MIRQPYVYSSVLVILFVAGMTILYSPTEPKKPSGTPWQKGVCWVGGRQIVTDKEIGAAKKSGVTWISQTPFGWQENPNSPVIRFDTTGAHGFWGESAEGIAVTTALAREQGIQSMLKPHLWVRNSWPGEINMTSPDDWEVWYDDYSKFILYYARIAESNGIEILCIGTELSFSTHHEEKWRELIASIRHVYHGKLTYAANFDGEFERVKFWDDLDFIGVQAYFPLANDEHASRETMVKAWKRYLNRLESLSERYNTPIVFTEIGYKSTADAAVHPWLWPQHHQDLKVSNEMQAECYEAFFRAAWNEPWLAGVYFWKWYPHGQSRMADIDFTPQGKPAEKVMARWFKNSQ